MKFDEGISNHKCFARGDGVVARRLALDVIIRVVPFDRSFCPAEEHEVE